MIFNPRIITSDNFDLARKELDKIGCDSAGVNIMVDKAVFTAVKLENVPAKAANLLKQTFLAKGGEVAVNRGTADLTVEYTDVLIFATAKEYKLALKQLKMQPWGLPKLAAELENALKAAGGPMYREYVWPDGKCLTIKPGRSLVMGILNITPDSFSDGGQFNTIDNALRQAEKMIADGADIIDIGAESTRPYGAQAVSAEIEMDRLLPVLEKVLASFPVPVSVDTYKAVVADAALKCGAHIINDVWGLQYDPDMAAVAAKYNVPVVVMHNQKGTGYDKEIMSHICGFLRRSINIGVTAGIDFSKIIVDPGIGFGKDGRQNLMVLSRLEELKALGCPILLGTSRKRFIGETLGGLPPEDRLEGTAATVSLGIAGGANIVRVHDVKSIARVVKMTEAILGGKRDE